MNADFSGWVHGLVHASVAGSVLVVLVLATQRILRRQLTPAWRCALWLLVLVRLLPFTISSDASVFNLLPDWRAAFSRTTISDNPAPVAAALPDLSLSGATPDLPPATLDSEVRSETPVATTLAGPVPASTGALAAAFIFYGWLMGVLALGGYVAVQSLSLRRSLAPAQPIDDPAVLAVLRAACTAMHLPRVPRLVESSVVRTPALCGVLRPRIILPRNFASAFSAEELRFVFLHELAHLRRGDLLLNWAMTALQIVHWFNPVIWFAFARWRVDREIACDAAALHAAGTPDRQAYGGTILRLLENLTQPHPRVGLVGILEEKRQLQRRLQMIADFKPAHRSLTAITVLAALAVVGLTDAQIPQPSSAEPIPSLVQTPESLPREFVEFATSSVLVVVNGSETMLGDTPSEVAHWRAQPDAQRLAAPKWQRTTATVESLLQALPRETNFQVALFSGEVFANLGRFEHPADPSLAIRTIVDRLRTIAPSGTSNFEAAFSSLADLHGKLRPERIVLVTDGLPTASRRPVSPATATESGRVAFFDAAVRLLPPRVPVHTVLLPSMDGDRSAPGLFWSLAHATRGHLTIPAKQETQRPTHVAFVIDTSGSMRDPRSSGLWPAAIDALMAVLDSHRDLAGVQVLDGDGRFILSRRGATGLAAWHANTPELRASLRAQLLNYAQDTVSNPVPGVYNAIRFLRDESPDQRMALYLLGDEFNSSEGPETVLSRLDTINPRDPSGRRRITINAIGFPTTIRFQFSMGNTGLRFASLMQAITQQHGGSFTGLPEL